MKKSISLEENMISEAHGEIQTLWKNLVFKFDALSNFSYIPPAAIPEPVFKTKNVSAIQIEEVQPSHISTSQTLSAEEIFSRARKLEGRAERTQREKQATRRMHKRVDKKKSKEFKKTLKETQSTNPKASQAYVKKKALQQVMGDKVNFVRFHIFSQNINFHFILLSLILIIFFSF